MSCDFNIIILLFKSRQKCFWTKFVRTKTLLALLWINANIRKNLQAKIGREDNDRE